jgi:DNA-binding response OmpR family regulator
MHHTKILLIEDNHIIAQQLYDYLEQDGFLVDYAHNGKAALKLIEQQQFDVVVLDLMLPDIDGIDICLQMKSTAALNMPILMLTARDSLSDKGEGFNAGADDYVAKPFEFAEIAMRCRALARRHKLHQSSTIEIGDLIFDPQKRRAIRAGKELHLSATDFEILNILVDAYPNAVSRHSLIEKVWGDDFPDSDVLRSHIYTLRKAVDKEFKNPLIKTIHGVGFKLSGDHAETT